MYRRLGGRRGCTGAANLTPTQIRSWPALIGVNIINNYAWTLKPFEGNECLDEIGALIHGVQHSQSCSVEVSTDIWHWTTEFSTHSPVPLKWVPIYDTERRSSALTVLFRWSEYWYVTLNDGVQHSQSCSVEVSTDMWHNDGVQHSQSCSVEVSTDMWHWTTKTASLHCLRIHCKMLNIFLYKTTLIFSPEPSNSMLTK
jgi:hypothetical protein